MRLLTTSNAQCYMRPRDGMAWGKLLLIIFFLLGLVFGGKIGGMGWLLQFGEYAPTLTAPN